MKRLISALALFIIIFLSACTPARVGVGVNVGPRPYYAPRGHYYPRPYYGPYWRPPHRRYYYHY